MQNIVLVILLIIALGLILIVLMQRSEGGGLGIGGGAGMSGRTPASPLAKVTWALGTGFMVASLVLTIIAKNNPATTSVIDQVGSDGTRPEADIGLIPPSGDSLPQPVTETAPPRPPGSEN
ncbi:MAG: preprotein translocase subunit SecG [Rhodobacteraceae bacterium]|nr:preprotein translocase subunit SecG [Paracoccaceae bacterium]